MSAALKILILFLVCSYLVQAGHVENKCLICREVLRAVHGHIKQYGRPSRRQIHNKFDHTCRRYSQYRRKCLLTLKHKEEFLHRELTSENAEPTRICVLLNECRAEDPI